jgi:hypothetical protein
MITKMFCIIFLMRTNQLIRWANLLVSPLTIYSAANKPEHWMRLWMIIAGITMHTINTTCLERQTKIRDFHVWAFSSCLISAPPWSICTLVASLCKMLSLLYLIWRSWMWDCSLGRSWKTSFFAFSVFSVPLWY